MTEVQNLEEMGGVDSTDEYVAIMRSLLRELHSRIETAVDNADGPKMSDKTKEEVKEALAEIMQQGCFGDGMEIEYIYGGTTFDGLNCMTDKELAYTLVEYTEDRDQSLAIKAMSELGIEEMLGVK
jgi:hypothetical protein